MKALRALIVLGSLLVLTVSSASAGTVAVYQTPVQYTVPNVCNGDELTISGTLITRFNDDGSSSLVLANAKAVGQTGITYVVQYVYHPSNNADRTFVLNQNYIGSDGTHAREHFLFIFDTDGNVTRIMIDQVCS